MPSSRPSSTELREQLAETTEKLDELLLRTPGIPWEGAPIGPDEAANAPIRTVGAPPEFDFTPLDHVELAEKRGWAEFARARKVAGERAYALISATCCCWSGRCTRTVWSCWPARTSRPSACPRWPPRPR